MYFFAIFLVFISLIGKASASARVCKKGDTLEIYANMIYYGTEADSYLSRACSQEIQNMWNRPKEKVTIGADTFNVKFVLSFQLATEKTAKMLALTDTDPANNYILVEEEAIASPTMNMSNHTLGANYGFYGTAENLGHSTTCAHEFGHGLGLKHYNERSIFNMVDANYVNKGQPGIMAQRGSIVDPKFQYDPKTPPGKPGGTINPQTRKVIPRDIQDLKLSTLKYNSKGCAYLGGWAKSANTKSGQVVKAKDYFLVSTEPGVFVRPPRPIYCHEK